MKNLLVKNFERWERAMVGFGFNLFVVMIDSV